MMYKKQIKSVLTVLLSFLFLQTFAQESFYVYFMQDGKRVNAEKSKIKLKKKPFEIYTEYTAPMDLLVSASFKNDAWHKAASGKLLSEIPVFNKRHKSLPTVFDFDKTLILSPETAFLWKKNMSDSTPLLKNGKGRLFNVKKVESLYNFKKSRILPLKNLEKDVFLIFVYTEKDKSGEDIEIQRETIKINWVNKFDEETKAYQKQKKREAKLKIKIAKQNLKRKQKLAAKEEKRLKKLEKEKQKREKKKQKTVSKNRKKDKKKDKEKNEE
ncbi:MAG: hypothetical protein GXO50_01230 [Chlorobi bacterium]|nr:hypothetical protein [Chlorobiota bacterium]